MNKTVILLISIILLSDLSFSQTNNTDSLFSIARDLAFTEKYEKSRIICDKILEINPDNSEALLLKAKTYGWDHEFDSARVIVKQMFEKDSSNYDVIDFYSSLEMWDGNYSKSLQLCNVGLKFYLENENLLLKKAKNLVDLENYEDAIEVLEHLLELYPDNEQAKKLLRQIQILQTKHKVSLGYAINIFLKSDLSPWHLLYLQYLRKTKIGNVIGRVNLANRYNNNGWQYEVDFYPQLTKRNYLYLNAGYSQSDIFPRWRFGAEIYHSFDHNFEVGVGFRQLVFDTSSVTILTGYVGKYFGNYWLSAHTYLVPANNRVSVSEILLLRKYFSDVENYLGFMIGYGVSPDDRVNLIINENDPSLKSLTFKFSFNHRIKLFWILNTGVAFTRDEFFIDNYRNIITFDIEFSRIF